MQSPTSKQQWLTWINEHGAGALSVTAFCRQNGIKPHNFYYHRKQLRKATSVDSSAFVQAQVQADQPHIDGQHNITLVCGQNVLHLPRGISPLWLAQFVSALK